MVNTTQPHNVVYKYRTLVWKTHTKHLYIQRGSLGANVRAQNMEEDTGGAIHNAVIGSSTGALLVYKDAQLVWAAKADMVPVTMQVSAFGPLKGLMCCIDEQGVESRAPYLKIFEVACKSLPFHTCGCGKRGTCIRRVRFGKL